VEEAMSRRQSFAFCLALVATAPIAASGCGGSTPASFVNPDSGAAVSGSSSGGNGPTGGTGPGVVLGVDAAASNSGDSGLAGCATGSAIASREPVYLLFVLDGSGSMSHDNKWVAVTSAIDAIFTDMDMKADDGIGAGLIVFSDSMDPTLNTGAPYPSAIDVPIGFVESTQLAKLVGRTAAPDAPQSNTPTGRALTGGYGELANFQPASPLMPGGKRVLVLITDGVPTDQACKTTLKNGMDNYAQNGCILMAGTELAATAPKGPIETFVIGVGPLPGDFATYDPYWLAALAVAGGTAPAGCNPKENAAGATDYCYFNVDPTGAAASTEEQAFLTAINSIRGQVSSCTLAITPTGAGTIDPSTVNVILDGTTVPQDPANGWTYDDPTNPTSVTLHGNSCDELKNDPHAMISIILGCKTVTPK
jgi:hypothetical protein